MTPEARRSTITTIRDWQRRCNSGAGSRRKSAKTAQSDAQYIVTQVAEGASFALGFVYDCVRADGYDVTPDEVKRVAYEMLYPDEVAAEQDARDAADTIRSLREGMYQ